MLAGVVRIRGGALLGALVILAITAMIAAACGQIMATALGAPGPGRFGAVDAIVQTDPTFHIGGENGDPVSVPRPALLPSADVARLAAIPGVRSATADIAFPVTIATPGGRPLASRGGRPADAHGWSSAPLAPFRLLRGIPPQGPQAVVLDAGLVRAGHLHLGEALRIATPAGTAEVRLSGIVAVPSAIRTTTSSVFFSDARAQALSGWRSGVDAIAVRVAPGAEGAALRRRIATVVGPHAQVLDRRHAAAADAGDPTAENRSEMVAFFASGGGLTLGIAIFILAGTIAFAVGTRRRAIALTRAIGATPAQVRRALLAGTAAIGVAGGSAGCAIAAALIGFFTHTLISVGLAPQGFRVAPSPIPYGIAIGASVVVAVAATLVAARRTLRVPPGEALVESVLPARRLAPVRILAGLLALGGGITLVDVLSDQALQYATLAAFCLIIAVTLLGPALLGRPLALLAAPLRRCGGSGFLTATGLTAGRFRIGAAGAAVALVVALTGTQVVATATTERGMRRSAAAQLRAGHVIVSRTGSGLPANVAAAARRVPRVRVTSIVSTSVYLLDHGLTNDEDAWNAVGVSGEDRRALALDVTAGSLSAVRGDTIAVSRIVASYGHVGVGSVVHARLADGTAARLRIGAVYRHASGLGDLVLPGALAWAHEVARVDHAVLITGAHSAAAVRALHAIAAGTPGATVLSRAAFLAQLRAGDRQEAAAQWVIDALMLFVAVLAAFNTGAIAAAERRGELGLARLAGATGGQLRRTVVAEALLATAAGLAVGVLVTVICFAGVGHDPTAGPLIVPGGQAALVLGGATLLGVCGQLVPALLARRTRPAALAADTA
ncbi:MAG TPA: FtsX-like permease family protein [Solirubrobacteraceae bacterium]